MAKKLNWKRGDEFIVERVRWRVTDVGLRVVVAIQVSQQDPLNLVGPPYSVAEIVFDEYDQEEMVLTTS